MHGSSPNEYRDSFEMAISEEKIERSRCFKRKTKLNSYVTQVQVVYRIKDKIPMTTCIVRMSWVSLLPSDPPVSTTAVFMSSRINETCVLNVTREGVKSGMLNGHGHITVSIQLKKAFQIPTAAVTHITCHHYTFVAPLYISDMYSL